MCHPSLFLKKTGCLIIRCLFVCWYYGGAGTIYSRFEHSSLRDIALFICYMLARYKLLTIYNLIALHLSRNQRFLCVEKASKCWKMSIPLKQTFLGRVMIPSPCLTVSVINLYANVHRHISARLMLWNKYLNNDKHLVESSCHR